MNHRWFSPSLRTIEASPGRASGPAPSFATPRTPVCARTLSNPARTVTRRPSSDRSTCARSRRSRFWLMTLLPQSVASTRRRSRRASTIHTMTPKSDASDIRTTHGERSNATPAGGSRPRTSTCRIVSVAGPDHPSGNDDRRLTARVARRVSARLGEHRCIPGRGPACRTRSHGAVMMDAGLNTSGMSTSPRTSCHSPAEGLARMVSACG